LGPENTRLIHQDDFFKVCIPKCDYIISNPPYSLKNEVLTRLFEIKKPFAMLMNSNELIASKKRYDLFSKNKFEIMYFDKRVCYFQNNNTSLKSISPPFSSVYICSNILPNTIIFEELNK
jgi:hypothetical protein